MSTDGFARIYLAINSTVHSYFLILLLTQYHLEFTVNDSFGKFVHKMFSDDEINKKYMYKYNALGKRLLMVF